MRRLNILLAVLGIAAFAMPRIAAEVKPASIFCDHMVIQRDLPVKVRGVADPDETVTVTFRGETKSTMPDQLGRWEIVLRPGSAGGPFDMDIQGRNTLHISDVLVGDVWVASGQSNMEFATKFTMNAEDELKKADIPEIRLLHVKAAQSPYQLDDLPAVKWDICSPETAINFSAVAFFFGKEIHEDQKIPIGIIDSTYGGTTAEAWVSLEALSSDASLMPVFNAWSHRMEDQAGIAADIGLEERKNAEAVAQGQPEPLPRHHPDFVSRTTPAILYNAMISPLVGFPIRGVIWYQGETNGKPYEALIYGRLFQTLIQDWRQRWDEGDFPFLFVQLANMTTDLGDGWPEVREGQRQALALRNTAMAVTIDVGNPTNVHPKDKQTVSHRLALAARVVSYGEPIEDSGPLYRMQTVEGQGIRVWFDHADGLKAKGGVLTGFEIAGGDEQFHAATAQIDGSTVVVTCSDVKDPVYVRYAWKDNPDGNLYNRADLPASPFRSRD